MTKKSTKRALLMSALSLLLCMSMLVGTTFAWFTDSASTSVNSIQAGNLDIALEKAIEWDANGDPTKWENAEGKTIGFKKADAGKKQDILWEPGCTYELDTIRVANKGNLALKFQVIISAMVGQTGENLAEVLEVMVNGQYLKASDGQTKLTLKDIMADPDGVAHGVLYPVNNPDNKDTEASLGKIALHMQESAGNEYQNASLEGIAITVLATQVPYEYDSSKNDYDENAKYSDPIHFGAGENATVTLEDGKTIAASGMDSVYQATDGAKVTINGNGNVVAVGELDGKGEYAMAVWAKNEGTKIIINGGNYSHKINNIGEDNKHYDLIYAGDKATIEINGGTFKAATPKWTLNCKDGTGAQIIVKGGRFYQFDPSQAGVKTGPNYVGENEVVVAEGYTVIKDGDWYEVVPASQAALQDTLNNRDSVVLGDDLAMTTPLNVTGNKVTLDMNGKKLTNTTDIWNDKDEAKTWSYLSVRDGAEVTLTGNGTFKTKENDCYAIDIRDGGKLTIEDGTYIGNITAVYVHDGELIIKGGTFDIQQTDKNNPYGYVINCLDANFKDGTAKVTIMGGSFKNFNPADNAAESANTNFVAAGYKVVERTVGNDTWYDVVPE